MTRALLALLAIGYGQFIVPRAVPAIASPSVATTLCADGGVNTLFVKAASTGTASGADWTNAMAFPSNPTRGKTYCLADGSYGAQTLNKAESSTTTITLAKCTTSDHGPEAGGYVSTLCDGQATFGQLHIDTGYWVVSGQARDESNAPMSWATKSAYGFTSSSVYSSNQDPVSSSATNVTLKYLDIGGTDQASETGAEGDCVYAVFNNRHNWTLSRNRIHNCLCMILNNGNSGWLTEYNYLQYGWQKETIRGQGSTPNWIIRYNVDDNGCQNSALGADPGQHCTGRIAIWSEDTAGAYDNIEVYGNALLRTVATTTTGSDIVIGGNGGSWVGVAANHARVYNNTIVGTPAGSNGAGVLVNGGTDNLCRNNLGYAIGIAFTVSCGTASDNTEVGSDPFVSSTNPHLSGATAAGTSLASPYNTDPDGRTRGSDGTWDLGAYEYVASSPALVVMKDRRFVFPVRAWQPRGERLRAGERAVTQDRQRRRLSSAQPIHDGLHDGRGERVEEQQHERATRPVVGARVRLFDRQRAAADGAAIPFQIRPRDRVQLGQVFDPDHRFEGQARRDQHASPFPGADVDKGRVVQWLGNRGQQARQTAWMDRLIRTALLGAGARVRGGFHPVAPVPQAIATRDQRRTHGPLIAQVGR